MAKLLKATKVKIEKLLNHPRVDNYHKTMLRAILHNSERNNLQRAEMEVLPLVLGTYRDLGF